MDNNKNKRIIINKSNTDLNNFHESKFKINLNRVAFIFLIVFTIIILYSTRVVYLSSKTFQNKTYKISKINRADIIDRHGNYISKSVFTRNVGIDPKLVKDKKKLLLKLQYTFPNLDLSEIKKKNLWKKIFLYRKKNNSRKVFEN